MRLAWKLLTGLLQSAAWLLGTLWEGLLILWRVGILLSRYREIVAESRFCPRGHEVAMYGLWDCGCGSRLEGWVFDLCPVCRETAGYTPCPTCGLPIRNPLMT